jgi:hypothetical protein
VLRIGILPRLNRSQRFGRDGGSVRRLTSPVNRATSVPSSEPRILSYFNVLSAFSLEFWRPHCFILSRLARPRTSVRLLTLPSTEVERSSMSLGGVPGSLFSRSTRPAVPILLSGSPFWTSQRTAISLRGLMRGAYRRLLGDGEKRSRHWQRKPLVWSYRGFQWHI